MLLVFLILLVLLVLLGLLVPEPYRVSPFLALTGKPTPPLGRSSPWEGLNAGSNGLDQDLLLVELVLK